MPSPMGCGIARVALLSWLHDRATLVCLAGHDFRDKNFRVGGSLPQ